MGATSLRNILVETLKGVDGIGKVHGYRRDTSHWQEFYERHISDGQLNNWEVTLASTAQEVGAVQNKAGVEPFFHNTHNFVIFGSMGMKDQDETEVTFHDLVDKVVEAVQKNNTLDDNLLIPAQLQGPALEHRMFGPVFVTMAEMNFQAIERVGG